ncbi:MAG: 2Fe-2S iron-sulfur cluster-binding protein [Actinomycetota bacterium]|nr:2Fe-2S iron-sulfur cluster-binding protein [Actinomycetota bacterium]
MTPLRRVSGRAVTTVEGLTEDEQSRWVGSFLTHGASQCGFCTPGIVCRLVGHERKGADLGNREIVDRLLAAHLCRCTGWQTIREAASEVSVEFPSRDLELATRQATLESDTPQIVGPQVVLGQGGFADDDAPENALVAVRDQSQWYVADSLHQARELAGKVQGRRSSLEPRPPLELPEGDWALTLRTCWVEPAYLETDASWCNPQDEPADPVANGGAFGGKIASDVTDVARELAQANDRVVRVLWSREDTVRHGPKRPPVSVGLRADGSGIFRLARTDHIDERIRPLLPKCEIEQVTIPGPPTSSAIRGAGWAEVEMLRAGLSGQAGWVTAPSGASAKATIANELISVEVRAGSPLDWVMFRSYCIGAAHMAYSWVTSEGLSVDQNGDVHDLTIRSFGVLRSSDTPEIEIISVGDGPNLAAGDAVFAAVAAATWLNRGCPSDLPTG